ncbi:MAG: archaeosortase/exosortase family protein [Nanoarchaeota archaeon]
MGGILIEIKKHWKKPGFRQFLIKMLVLFTIFFLLPIVLFPILETMRYNGKIEWHGKLVVTDPLPFYLIDVGAALIFWGLTFVLFARNKLLKLKPYPNRIKDNVLFGIVSLLFLGIYLYVRYWTSHNVEATFAHRWTYVSILLGSLGAFFLSMTVALLTVAFIKDFGRKLKKELLLSVALIAGYFFITSQLRVSWIFLGNFVAKSVVWLLGKVFDNVVLVQKGHSFTLGAEGFVAQIGDTCSGIESIGLFLGLFVVILAMDWHEINKKKMFLLLIPGLVGTILMNIFRITLLYIAGVLISPAFAIGMFHSNAGWVLFIIFFLAFWAVSYPWVKHNAAH